MEVNIYAVQQYQVTWKLLDLWLYIQSGLSSRCNPYVGVSSMQILSGPLNIKQYDDFHDAIFLILPLLFHLSSKCNISDYGVPYFVPPKMPLSPKKSLKSKKALWILTTEGQILLHPQKYIGTYRVYHITVASYEERNMSFLQ